MSDEQNKIEHEQNTNKYSLGHIKESISNAPQNLTNAIEEGKAQPVIESMQEILQLAIRSIFSSCQFLSIQQILLGEREKQTVSRNAYFIAALVGVLQLFLCILDFSLNTLLTAFGLIISGFIASNLITKKSEVLSHKPQKNTKKPKKQSDSEDILL